jgi:hypothetical protein
MYSDDRGYSFGVHVGCLGGVINNTVGDTSSAPGVQRGGSPAAPPPNSVFDHHRPPRPTPTTIRAPDGWPLRTYQ